jgi:hypothetical protein
VYRDGIQIICETQGILPVQNYYFYRWIGYEQHVNVLSPEMGDPISLYGHRSMKIKYKQVIRTGNADQFHDFLMKNHDLIYISLWDMSNYIIPIDDSTSTLASNYFDGLLFKLEQLSISDNAYSFWRDAELQLEAEGKLFDPVATQLKGNIRCVTDSLKDVIGIFNASDVSEKYAYFYLDGQNRTTSKIINGFPTLYLDSSYHVNMPGDWIRR